MTRRFSMRFMHLKGNYIFRKVFRVLIIIIDQTEIMETIFYLCI